MKKIQATFGAFMVGAAFAGAAHTLTTGLEDKMLKTEPTAHASHHNAVSLTGALGLSMTYAGFAAASALQKRRRDPSPT